MGKKPAGIYHHTTTPQTEDSPGRATSQIERESDEVEIPYYGFNSSQKVNEMEKEPAYIRRNVKLEKCGSTISRRFQRYTLSNEDEKKSLR